ncbi:hypothetical protein FQN54_008755 [Arachnomyces sp. PD_36]|nr:hypothetical protein FQN54_008755 [Arachnomyces sp. PD_36]
MEDVNVLRKDQLEASLHQEKKLIDDGTLKEENPLDLSESFRVLCDACRRGDLKVCQEKITEGVNINARDLYDYTPLILASLCGHYEVVQLLLDTGALCERDTFQGERCLYNALNDKIRNLLLQYDYSKSTDPLQPFASHLASLLTRDHPRTSDIVVTTAEESFHLHKFVLAARSPYFQRKLSEAPETTTWKLPSAVPAQAFSVAIKYLYLGEVPRDIKAGPGTGFTEAEVLAGIDKIAKQLEVPALLDRIIDSGDRRLARQRRAEDVENGRNQMERWFRDNVLRHKIVTESRNADEVKWDRDNGIYADVLLRADEDSTEVSDETSERDSLKPIVSSIPIGPGARPSRSPSRVRRSKKSTLFPAHRAMLLRSEFFLTMFSSSFREAQVTDHLQIVSIDCSPEILELVLTHLYTEWVNFSLDTAVDVLFAADLLLIEKLKTKAAIVISTLGNGNMSQLQASTTATKNNEKTPGGEEHDQEPLDIYEIIHAAWLTRVQRLEEFAARYLAYRLESHIDLPEFSDLIRESAARIEKRQETDSIELLDDIRYYLSERFRLRFEDSGLEDMMDEDINNQNNGGAVEEAAVAMESLSLPSWGTGPSAPAKLRETPEDEGVDVGPDNSELRKRQATGDTPVQDSGPVIRTLDGEVAGDEFASDAINYQILLGKLDRLLETLDLDA